MATCIQEIHLDDIGTVFEVALKDCDEIVDVSQASAMYIIFQKPDGTSTTKTAGFTTDGTDGKVRYITTSGDLNLIGGWKIQAKVTLPSGTWSSNISKFKVYSNL